MNKITSAPLQRLLLLMLVITGYINVSAANILSGEIKGLRNKSIQLILEEDINRKIRKTIADIPVDANGRFRFEKELIPHIYSLQLNEETSVMLAINKGQLINIIGDATDANSLQVTGSEDTRLLHAYEKFRKESLQQLVISVRNQIKELTQTGIPEDDPGMTELIALETMNYEKHKNELIEFIKKEMGTSIAVYPTSLRWSGENNLTYLKDLAQRFEAAHVNTAIAAKLTEKVNVLLANSIGGKVMDIKMPDKDGKTVTLSSLHSKFILIDFWASWCLPCRRESALLGELYQKFKPQDFEIYGVALESTKEAWLKAIDRDKRIWINVSTFQEFKTPAAFDYSVTALPSNVLIDGSGKVIAKNLHGKELKQAIEKLFSKSSSIDNRDSGKFIEPHSK